MVSSLERRTGDRENRYRVMFAEDLPLTLLCMLKVTLERRDVTPPLLKKHEMVL